MFERLVPGASFWLTRVVFLRCLAAIYNVAFVVAYMQNGALIGRNGLLPADIYLSRIAQSLPVNPSVWDRISRAPTVLWWLPLQNIDFHLNVLSLSGCVLSLLVFLTGASNMLVMTLLWALYHSIVAVGQQWYSFGWESQLLETGFLAIWLCPLLKWEKFPERTRPSRMIIWCFRWLIFRIMIGAGLIKLRGDSCWRDLSCMNYHYETQPVPNALSYYLHQSPISMHQIEVLTNHVVELPATALIMMPFRTLVVVGGLLQIAFMTMIMISGNLSFLNQLTMLPSICCLDDRFLRMFFSKKSIQKVESLETNKRPTTIVEHVRSVVNLGVLMSILYLSYPVVLNLISPAQQMNTSFEPLRIVNTYGAFGSITKERTEVVMQGTVSDDVSNGDWFEYEFKCKPGNTTRRPCFISPYHYRLDWLMWFAAFQTYQHNPWLVHLAIKMLENDAQSSELLAMNPFIELGTAPKFIRFEHYKYSFTELGAAKDNTKWWSRKRIGSYLPAVNLKSLASIRKQMNWDRHSPVHI